MKSRRVASCIFCDDIRAELGNKLSLMGIYASDVLITVPPPLTLKIGIVVWLISDINDVPAKFVVRLLAPPDKSEVATVSIEGDITASTIEPDDLSQNLIFRLVVPIPQLTLTEDGFVEVMVEVDGEEPFRAGRLRVKFNVDPATVGTPSQTA